MALVFGDDGLHELDNGHVVKAIRGLEEGLLVAAGFVIVVLAHRGDHDLGMVRGLGLLGVVEDFLEELLSIAQAGVLDIDILGTGELDHALGEVDNAYGGTHIEHEDLAALAHGAGLEDELAGFGDEHEEADDIGMGDGDGTALANLLSEDGNHRTVATQHIAETGGNELGDTAYLALDNGFVERLTVDLANALAATHDIGGVDGFIGGDHDELEGAVLDSEVGHDAGAVDIVLHSDAGVVFHHGHMLIGGGMEDIVGTVGSEDALHMFFIGDAADDGVAQNIGILAGHHEANIVHGGLGLVDEDHQRGLIDGNLAHHLRTDRAGGSGDEDALASELSTDGVHIDFDLIAGKEVFDVDLVEVLVGEL